MDKGNRLYVAYGSNLNRRQMAHRCPDAEVVGATDLTGCRLLFRGAHECAVATVEAHEGGRVPVLVWAISPGDERSLDRYEGYPFLYRKERVWVDLDGKRTPAMVYIMNTEVVVGELRSLGQPSIGYYAGILESYREAGFDPEILRRATEDSVEDDGLTFPETESLETHDWDAENAL